MTSILPSPLKRQVPYLSVVGDKDRFYALPRADLRELVARRYQFAHLDRFDGLEAFDCHDRRASYKAASRTADLYQRRAVRHRRGC